MEIFELSQIGTCEIFPRIRSVFTCQSCHHWILLRCEIHEHLHPNLLLKGLHDVCLVLELLPQLGDGGIRLLLERAQTSLELSHLASQKIYLQNKIINIKILNDFLRCLYFFAFGCGFLIFTAWLSRATNLAIMNHWQCFTKKKLGSWTIHKISDNSIFICQYKYFHSSITVLLSLSWKDRPFVNLDIAVMQSKSTDWYTPFNNRKKIHLQINNNCAMRHCTASRKIFSIAINELL